MSDVTYAGLARTAIELAESATAAPWSTVAIPLTPTPKGIEYGCESRSFVAVQTTWDHPMLKRPEDLPAVVEGMFYAPSIRIHWPNPNDPVFIARARALVPELARAVLDLQAKIDRVAALVNVLRHPDREEYPGDDRQPIYRTDDAMGWLLELFPEDAHG